MRVRGAHRKRKNDWVKGCNVRTKSAVKQKERETERDRGAQRQRSDSERVCVNEEGGREVSW